MRIAITSQNFRTITGHAGKCRRFLILEGAAGGEPQELARLDLDQEMSFHEFGGGAHPVDGCDVLVTQSCGMGFRQRLMARGIQVVVTTEENPLKAARACLHGEPLPTPAADCSDHDHHHDHAHGHAEGGCGCATAHKGS